MVVVFIDDDPGYLAWVAANPDGFVLNSSLTSPRTLSHVVHRATCTSITGQPARGRRWTRDYLKACGDREMVVKYGHATTGVAPTNCGLCMRRPSPGGEQ